MINKKSIEKLIFKVIISNAFIVFNFIKNNLFSNWRMFNELNLINENACANNESHTTGRCLQIAHQTLLYNTFKIVTITTHVYKLVLSLYYDLPSSARRFIGKKWFVCLKRCTRSRVDTMMSPRVAVAKANAHLLINKICPLNRSIYCAF